MDTHRDGNYTRYTHYSLDEFATNAYQALNDADPYERDRIRNTYGGPTWRGVERFEDAVELSKYGWKDGLTEAMPIAEQALDLVEADIETIEMNPLWDVTGGEVDVGRYVQGIPENMVEYELTPVSTAGRVIALCASTVYSGSISTASVMKRGAAITALALALERTGHETELWADMTTQRGGYSLTSRVLVKGVNDVVDPERIAFAYAHPSFLRQLLFADWLRAPKTYKRALSIPGGYGTPAPPHRDLPEGTIYLPELKSNHDVEDPDKLIIDTLTELGLAK